MRVGLKKMISITMVIRTAFALMLSTVFIRRFVVTPANIHDNYVWADSAYSGERFKDLLSLAGFENRIHEKGSRNHPLSTAAIERNSIRYQTRARVKHVFGCFDTSMVGKFTRKIGLKKNKTWWSLKNLTFNFLRYLYHSSNLFASI